ncbi:hypothetical protein RFI_35240, partial [Reticulomyxa filosa]
MSNVEREVQEHVESGSTKIHFDQQCFGKNWILQSNKQEQVDHFICLICKQVANNPVEINCNQHKDMNETFIVGENCLKKFLNDNNNKCPIEFHDGCQYYKLYEMQKQINQLNVICQRQFEDETKEIKEQVDGDIMVICDFKGKIQDMNEHLNNQCKLKVLDCWFKQFGCDHSYSDRDLKQHLVDNMEQHFNIVIKKFEYMQKIIEQQRDEIKQLKSEKGIEVEKLEEEIKLNNNNEEKKENDQLI